MSSSLSSDEEAACPLISAEEAAAQLAAEEVAFNDDSVPLKECQVTDSDPAVPDNAWSYKKRVAFRCVIFLAVLLPLFFLLVLPEVVNDMVGRTDMRVDTVTIVNPTDTVFTINVKMAFSKKSPIDCHVRLRSVDVSAPEVDDKVRFLEFRGSANLPVVTSPTEFTSQATVLDLEGFTAFSTYSIGAAAFTWHMTGSADVTSLIPVQARVDKRVALTGFNGFSNFPPVVNSLSLVDGSADTLFLTTVTTLTIESNVALALGQELHFRLRSNGILVGIGTIPDCTLQSGSANYTVDIALSPSSSEGAEAEIMSVLGNYVAGIPTSVSLSEFYLPEPVTWLAPGLATITMDSAMPSINDKLLEEIDMTVSITHLVNVPFTLLMYNAVDSPLLITALAAEIEFEGQHIATVDETGLSITIPPRSTAVSSTLSARVDLKHTSTLLDLLKAESALLDVYSTVTATIGDFPVQIKYDQMQVPTVLHK